MIRQHLYVQRRLIFLRTGRLNLILKIIQAGGSAYIWTIGKITTLHVVCVCLLRANGKFRIICQKPKIITMEKAVRRYHSRQVKNSMSK